jgi:hypothetical protein
MTTVSFWDEIRGAPPGGTFATMFNEIQGQTIQPPRTVTVDPFLRRADGSQSQHICKAVLPVFPAHSTSPWDSTTAATATKPWTAPFIMALVNEQVVRWSYALRSQGLHSITYTEAAWYPDFQTAFVNYVGFFMFASMLFNPITSQVLKNYVLPKPGQGPSMKDMETKRRCQCDCESRCGCFHLTRMCILLLCRFSLCQGRGFERYGLPS